MTRFWAAGQPVRMGADSLGTPLWFLWTGQRHNVIRVCRRWRVDEDWWKPEGAHVWREYFIVVTDTGLLVVLYHNFVDDRWFISQVYD